MRRILLVMALGGRSDGAGGGAGRPAGAGRAHPRVARRAGVVRPDDPGAAGRRPSRARLRSGPARGAGPLLCPGRRRAAHPRRRRPGGPAGHRGGAGPGRLPPGRAGRHRRLLDGWPGRPVPRRARPAGPRRVGTLVMLGTPNHGTIAAWVPATVGGFGRWNATGGDMRPGSPFLRSHGRRRTGRRAVRRHRRCPALAPGSPPRLRRRRSGPRLRRARPVGVAVPGRRRALPRPRPPRRPGSATRRPSAWSIQALGLPPGRPPIRRRRPTSPGPATIRLEYAAIADDHDRWTDDENRFAVSVDPDGGGDGFVPLGEIAYERDAPFTQNWGDGGPSRRPDPAARARAPASTSASTCPRPTPGAARWSPPPSSAT